MLFAVIYLGKMSGLLITATDVCIFILPSTKNHCEKMSACCCMRREKTIDGSTVEGEYVPELLPLSPAEVLLFDPPTFTVVNETFSVPEYLMFKHLKLSLKHLCREAIRRHLL